VHIVQKVFLPVVNFAVNSATLAIYRAPKGEKSGYRKGKIFIRVLNSFVRMMQPFENKGIIC